MTAGFGGLEVARSGMYVSERGLDVTGHNISNVNTPGYTRQQAISATADYQNCVTYQLGLGADIQEVRQIRHVFIDNVYRNENKTLGYWEAKQNTYLDIQSIIGESMDSGKNNGLQSTLNQFWDSWQELSKDPGNLTVRASVKQRGEMLVKYANHLGAQLDKAQSDLDLQIMDKIDEINGLTGDIAKLNLKITQTEINGDHANDLRDQRNLDIDKLSKLIDCQANEMQDGQIDITVGGYFLVSKADAEKVTAAQNKAGSLFCAPAINEGKTLLPVKSGTLKGLMESRGEVTGDKISLDNGNVSDKIDLVFAFNTDDSDTQRDNILANIDSIVKSYKDRGISVRLGYVTFDSSGMTNPATYIPLDADGSSSVSAFKTAIDAPLTFGNTTASGKCTAALEDIISATESADTGSGWKNASRQIVLLSDNAIDAAEDLTGLSGDLKDENVHTLVISDISNENELSILSSATGDRFLDTDTVDASSMDDTVFESLRNCIYGSVIDTKNSIPDVKRDLNLIISAVVREVNNLQKSGMTLGSNSQPGEDFFVPIDSNYPMQMGNIMLNPKLENLNNIVASRDTANGDNTIALAVSDLRNSTLLGNISDVQSIDGFYQSLIMAVGSNGSEAVNSFNSQNTLMFSVDNQRQSIMNVSMDEEMSNMMKYQYAYGASSKVINAFTEMFDTIIQRLGLAGR